MTNNFSKVVLLASVSVFAATAAMAQSAPTETATESVVVSGSRISASGFEAPTPVSSVSANDIANSGEVTIGDVLDQMPQFGVGASPVGSWSGSYGSGGNYVNLRNLGQTRTLVLLDGERLIPSTLTNAIDLNTLPSALVQRVDVVTGGASAAWGSDAVSGVVNYVLDKQYSGLKGSIQYGNTSHFDYQTYKADIAFGTDFAGGRGHLLLSGSYLKSPDVLLANQRSWFHDPGFMPNPNYVAGNGQTQYIRVNNIGLWQATQGGVITGGPLAGTQFVGQGVAVPYNPGQISGVYSAGGDAETQTIYEKILASPQQGNNLFAYGSYKINNSIVGHVSADFAQDGETTSGNPDFFLGNITVSADNPFLPASVKSKMTGLGLTSFPFGSTMENLACWADCRIHDIPSVAKTTLYRLSAGLDGTIGDDWSWKVYSSYSQAHFMQTWYNNPIQAKLKLAMDAVANPVNGTPMCRSTLTNPTNGCVPLDMFGVGVASPGALAYINQDTYTLSVNHMVAFGSSINGTLFSNWAGPVSVASGFDWRFQSASAVGSPVTEAFGAYAGNKGAFSGSQQVAEGFLEVNVPLVKDAWFARSADFDIAGRVTNYTRSGAVETWKLGINDQITDDLRIRGTYSYDIRAPNLNELFSTGSSGAATPYDPLHPTQTPSINTTTTGNLNLRPENAHTFTGGVVLTPESLPGLNLSVDYYNITVAGEIASVGAAYEVLYCATGTPAQQAQYCPFVVRDSNGILTQVFTVPFNSARASTGGIDFELEYSHELFGGDMRWHASGNYTDHNTAVSSAGIVTDNAGSLGADTGGGGLPKFHMNLAATYSDGPFTWTLSARMFSSARNSYLFTPGMVPNNTVPWVVFPDIKGTYNFKEDSQLQFYWVVENFLNIPPPEIPYTSAATTGYYNPQTLTNTYDTLGRRFTIGIRANL